MADIVRAGEELGGYVSLEEGVGCGVWRHGQLSVSQIFVFVLRLSKIDMSHEFQR